MPGMLEKIFGKVLVKNLMKSPAVTINQEENLSVASEKFAAHRASHLVVVDNLDHVVGILSHKYLYKTQSPRKFIGQDVKFDPNFILDGDAFYEKRTLDSYILKYVMKPNPLTLRPGNTILDAVRMMNKFYVDCIPVVNKDKKIEGVIMEHQVIQYIAKILEEEERGE